MISNGRKRLVIYTTLLGGYDFLREPSVITPECDYICFTDDPTLKSDVWQFVDVSGDKGSLPQNKWNRKYKVLAHRYLSEYDASLYVDSNVRLIGNIWDYIKISGD